MEKWADPDWKGWFFEYVTRIKGISSKKRAKQQQLVADRIAYFERLLGRPIRLERMEKEERFKVFAKRES